MQRGFQVVLAVLIACGTAFAAEQTWTGQISSSMCGTTHMSKGCIRNCVKAGEKYGFVSKGKAREIKNQDFGGLEKYAGDTVKLTGTLSPDGKTVTVSKVELVSAR